MKIPKIPDMDTLRKARDSALMKWDEVRSLKNALFHLVDQVCGLCQHAKLKARAEGNNPASKCHYCGSTEFCDKLMKDFHESGELLDELTSRVLNHLRTMEVGD